MLLVITSLEIVLRLDINSFWSSLRVHSFFLLWLFFSGVQVAVKSDPQYLWLLPQELEMRIIGGSLNVGEPITLENEVESLTFSIIVISVELK